MVICSFLIPFVVLLQLAVFRMFFFRPLKLRYNMYASFGPLWSNCWFSFFFCILLFKQIHLFVKTCKFTVFRQSRWDRAFLYWYLQCLVTRPTEQYLDSFFLFFCVLYLFFILIFICLFWFGAVWMRLPLDLCAQVYHPNPSEKVGPLGRAWTIGTAEVYPC